MKKKYLLIIIIVVGMLTLLASCKDDVSISDLKNEPEMVVYCFPSTADTTYIHVSRSMPVRNYNDNMKLVNIDDAAINYTVNGQPQTVSHREDGYYYVLAKQHPGDKIAINVSAYGLNDVSGETTIPDTVAIGNADIRNVAYRDEDFGNMENFYQLSVDFNDPAESKDYYATRVKMKQGKDTVEYVGGVYYGDKFLQDTLAYHSLYYYPKVYSQGEPLLNPISKVDDIFGYSNDSYNNLCIFDDASINGQSYKLHVNVSPDDRSYSASDYEFSDVIAYSVEILHITPEFYNFLQSVNSLKNSDLAQHGLAQIQPTLSNVHGGFGLIAGWNASHSNYIAVNQ